MDVTSLVRRLPQWCKEEGVGLDTSRLWARKSEQVSHDWEEKASGHRREAEGADGDVHLLRLNRGGRCLEKIGLDLR